MSKRVEILISGYGGQGVVRMGQVLGSATVAHGLFCTMLISHGTETRGGYVRSQLVIADEFIDNPTVEHPDYFCALSSVAYERFKGLVGPLGKIIHDPALVTRDPVHEASHVPIEASTSAKEVLGQPILANTVILGALSRFLSDRLPPEQILGAIYQRIPRFHEENRRAFNLGFQDCHSQ